MKSRFTSRRLSLALFALLLLCSFVACPLAARAQTSGLQTTFDARGLATLRYNGATLTDTAAHGDDAFTLYDVDGAPLSRDWNDQAKTLTWNYKWGRVACHYAQRGDQLDLDIAVENTGARALDGFNIFPLALRFQGFPVGYDGSTPHVRFNSDGPTSQSADFGRGIVTIINRDVAKTLAVGLTTTSETSDNFRYNVYVGSAPLWYQPNNWPRFTRPIAPGGRDLYEISLCFSPPGTSADQLESELYQRFAQARPFELGWQDKRPIGALFLSSAPAHPALNPRGWFNNDASVDVTTPAGRARFAQRVLEYADASIAELQMVGAQGMVTWDIEGQQYPHATSYIGDPRLVGQLAPEMEPIADAYFKKFRDAGLRVGLCVRPQVLRLEGEVTQQIVADEAEQLIARIRYARDRWGCSLFYVDSNGGPFDPSDATVFGRVAREFPDVLLIPEHQNLAYYANTAPYNHISENPAFTSPEVRRLYPRAFSVVKVEGERIDTLRAEMVTAARNGDILMFNAWFDSAEGRAVRDAMAQANLVNRAPVAQDGAVNTCVGYSVKKVLLASDPDGDALTFRVVNGAKYGNSAIRRDGNGVWRLYYSSLKKFWGDDAVRFVAVDAQGHISNVATITIHFLNRAPRAVSAQMSVAAGGESSQYLFGDDPDGDEIVFCQVNGARQGTSEIARDSEGKWRVFYHSRAGYSGPDVVTFVTMDTSNRTSRVATINVNVIGVSGAIGGSGALSLSGGSGGSS